MLEESWKNLPRGKATSVDLLQDTVIKQEEVWEKIKDKMFCAINLWLNDGLPVPDYLKTTRMIALTKDKNKSRTPEVGDVRTIAVASPIAKLYERTILQLLEAEVQ